MTSASHEPLSQEERELAQRLAQLGAPGGPPASLDARILSAAHAALAGKSPRPSRRPRRWPMALGAVATLALAVGVAWQLRPRPDAEQAYSEAPVAAERAMRDSGPSAAEELPAADLSATVAAPEADAAQVMEAPPPPPSPAPVVAARKVEPKAPAPADDPAVEAEEAEAFPQEPERRAAPAPAVAPAPPAPPPPRADIVFDQPAPVDAQAPAAAASGANAATGSARVQREATGEAKQARQARQESGALDQIVVTGTRIDGPDEEREDARDNAGYSDQEIDDQPPATADSPLVQKAWLQRIRELIADGKQDEASNSLAEFKRRYPRYALPEDLQELLP